jgi:flagellar biosynthetic protein FliR
MVVNLDEGWIGSVFLVALRVGTLLMMSPIFSGLSGLVTVRVLLTIGLSAVLVGGSAGAGAGATAPLTAGAMLFGAAGEVFVGATMAFGVFAAFGAFSVAGKILDIQSGFSIGSVYDPVTRGGAPLFSTMLNLVGVTAFFGMDAHHALLRGLAFSLAQAAPGAGLSNLSAEPVIRQFGLMFSLGVALIVPVMLCLLLVEVGLAMISRVLPQMNVFFVMVPVKIFAALAILALTVSTLAPAMASVYASIFLFWERVLT